MELYVLVAGEANSVKRWQEDLSAQFLPIYDGEGKQAVDEKGLKLFQRLIIAPVIPYKIAFHKENLDHVLAMVGSEASGNSYVEKRYGTIAFLVKWFRKILKLKEVPAAKRLNVFMQPNVVDKAVTVIPIGIKDDLVDDKGKELI